MIDPLAFTATDALPPLCVKVGGILGQLLAAGLLMLYRKDIGSFIRSAGHALGD